MTETNATERGEPFARILVVGAHPDDAEFHAGGLMISQAARGSQIGILSLTDGSAGHQETDRPGLAARRLQEARAAAALLGAEVWVWPVPDGELTPSLALRRRLVAHIRTFRPDLILTHRTCDYHPDHRAAGQLVQDACYLLRVPNVVPEVPPLAEDPLVLSMADFFTRPVPFRADVVLPTDSVLARVLDLLACHESQVFEWLPFITGTPPPAGKEQRGEWLRAFYGQRPAAVAGRWAPEYGYAEAFELSEYGRRLAVEEIRRRLGALEPT